MHNQGRLLGTGALFLEYSNYRINKENAERHNALLHPQHPLPELGHIEAEQAMLVETENAQCLKPTSTGGYTGTSLH